MTITLKNLIDRFPEIGGAEIQTDHCCRAGKDGDCGWRFCPQLRDGEPEESHRHCPYDAAQDDDDGSAYGQRLCELEIKFETFKWGHQTHLALETVDALLRAMEVLTPAPAPFQGGRMEE